eukprot:3355287-Amphidinium_carterae.1
MTQELIASIQTSADGVTTETMTMQRAMVVRRETLHEHLESVPSSLSARANGIDPMKKTCRLRALQPDLDVRR